MGHWSSLCSSHVPLILSLRLHAGCCCFCRFMGFQPGPPADSQLVSKTTEASGGSATPHHICLQVHNPHKWLSRMRGSSVSNINVLMSSNQLLDQLRSNRASLKPPQVQMLEQLENQFSLMQQHQQQVHARTLSRTHTYPHTHPCAHTQQHQQEAHARTHAHTHSTHSNSMLMTQCFNYPILHTQYKPS